MYDVFEKSIAQLQADMEAGVTTSEEIVLGYLDRIAKLDKDGPAVNSVIEINPDAIFIARALDRERKMKGPRGPMHGIPVMVKDNVSTGDKMQTTAGSLALEGNFALSDAPVIKRLREAGAVLLGKTNLSEFARYLTTDIPNGYSSRGGQTLNPYDAKLDPLGSSTGSAVALAMSLTAAAVGTETSGSIVSPSSYNGVVGLKPTIGLVSRSGIIPINSQDTAGPMGRTVADVAALLGAMTGEDEDDPATLSLEGIAEKDYLKYLDKDALKGVRIGVSIPENSYTPEQIEAFKAALPYLEKAGATLVYGCTLPRVNKSGSFLARAVMLYEFRKYIDSYLAKYCSLSHIRDLGDIIEYNNRHAEAAIKYGQNILEESHRKTSGRLTESLYLSEKVRLTREAGALIDKTLADNEVDLVVHPIFSELPPISGYPILNIPAGIAANGLPTGLSMIAGAFSEAKLLAWGYAFEQASQLRVVPEAAKI